MVLRCALLKQQRQLSYKELAFYLEDFGVVSRLCPAAAGMVAKEIGAASNDQQISAIRPATWEALNRALVASAKEGKLEAGAMVRTSTVTAALMHAPSDSALLWDAVR